MLGRADGDRLLAYAVAASLALHALVLALRLPEPSPPTAPAARPLVAQIVQVEPYNEPAAPAQPEAPPPSPPKREKAKEVSKPRTPAARAVRPEIPAPAEPPAPAEAPATATAEPAVLGQPGVASAPPAQVVVPDTTTTIAQYRQKLISEAVRYKRYPPRAVDNGWEGDVVVRIAFGANGQLAELKVRRGSGHGVLDEQALEMFRLAAPKVPVPPSLRGQEFAFEVRAIYSLKD